MVGRKNLAPNFSRILLKVAEKALKKSFLRKFTIDPSAERCIDVFLKNGQFFFPILA